MPITIATWNVNSVKARLPNVIEWLKESQTDIVCLQELKCQTEAFPYMEIEDAGYNVAAHGQKSYNGVAILSKFPIDEVALTELPGEPEDEQARYIEAVISTDKGAIRVASIYVPNGGEVGSDKFAHKMRFYDRLRKHATELLTYDEALILAADYNVAPRDLDVYDPEKLRGTTCFHPDEQEKYHALLYTGLTDVYETKYPNKQGFTWWDYRGSGYQKNHGYRIDHLLLSAQAADKVIDCHIDEAPRAKEKASDHTPLVVTLDL